MAGSKEKAALERAGGAAEGAFAVPGALQALPSQNHVSPSGVPPLWRPPNRTSLPSAGSKLSAANVRGDGPPVATRVQVPSASTQVSPSRLPSVSLPP